MRIGCLVRALIVLAVLSAPGQGIAADNPAVFKVETSRMIDYAVLAQELSKADIILVGELHDRVLHHKHQLDVIKALTGEGVPIAIGLEMFPNDGQRILDNWTEGRLSTEDFIAYYQKSWTFPWQLYEEIFLYAREKNIPLVALNVPRRITKKVRESGFLSLSEEERKELPPGLGCTVDENYMEFIRKAFRLHGKSDRQFLYFCETQLLWDKSMAWFLLKYRERAPERKVVVITGLTHAAKRGIPAQLREFGKGFASRVLLPEVPGVIDRWTTTVQDTDYLLPNNGSSGP